MPRRVLRLIELRLILGFSLLLSLFLIQLTILPLFPISFFYYFLALLFLLSVVYLILYKFGIEEKTQVIIQIFGDWGILTYLVIRTGGYESSLYFLFLFLILESFFFLEKEGVIFSAFSPFFSYLLLSFSSFYFKYPNPKFNYQFFTTNLLLYGVGFPLIGYFMISSKERLRSLTRRMSSKESMISFFKKIDKLLSSKTGNCFLLIEGDKILGKSENCSKFPIDNLIDEEGEMRIRDRVYNVTKTALNGEYMIVISDITHQDMKIRREGMGEAASILSHEIKNPLSSILGAIQMYEISHGEKKDKIIEIVRESAERIKSMLRQWDKINLAGGINVSSVIEYLKEILGEEGAEFKEEKRSGEIILMRNPPLEEREISMLLNPKLHTLETGKGLMILEFMRIISLLNAKLFVEPWGVKILLGKDGKDTDNRG